jgi:hypothetical protein
MMRAFRACPVPDGRLLGGLPRVVFTVEGHNSLVAGKNAGNFADSAVFRENTSQKHLRIQ